jgi:1-acyl-sn-glycerol-3-phosphate acyltransferase
VANFIGDRYFLSQIKRGELVIDGVFGEEYLDVLKKGAVVICNHLSPADNYIVFHAIRKALPKKYLYKVVKEGNYTGFRGLYGLFFRHCNTLPLSRNRRTMMKFTSAVQTLLSRGESILIYPEQSMWRGYKKPRPFQIGAFKIAAKANVPVLPIFITMEDDVSRFDRDGCPLLRHTVHILPPIFSQTDGGERALPKDMLQRAEALYKQKYEQVYKTPLGRG